MNQKKTLGLYKSTPKGRFFVPDAKSLPEHVYLVRKALTELMGKL